MGRADCLEEAPTGAHLLAVTCPSPAGLRPATRIPSLHPWQAEREEQEEGYDSDTAEAVQRRLAQLKKEQRPRAAERLPDRLYDERREQQQLRQLKEQQRERRRSRSRSREQEQRRPGSASREPQRRRSRSREPQRRRSRSRSRDRRGDHRRRRSRSRDERGDRYRGYDSRRRSRDRRRHVGGRRSRSRGRRERSRSQDRRQGGDERQRGGGGGAAPVLQQYDFEALIPGYQGMSVVQVSRAVALGRNLLHAVSRAATGRPCPIPTHLLHFFGLVSQKMRAKTQYLLERSAAQDERRGEPAACWLCPHLLLRRMPLWTRQVNGHPACCCRCCCRAQPAGGQRQRWRQPTAVDTLPF